MNLVCASVDRLNDWISNCNDARENRNNDLRTRNASAQTINDVPKNRRASQSSITVRLLFAGRD
ncbi:hypothetical protein NBRC111894_1844 [Sporolactobacillus inulinus]|uniref:Uncharacterized protein n=1 Tax=Sporolactobacillus inulinus TaxID=2078 RepID=A0A4Y1ZB91_9BACL|nr:hypothetical protein NBRC111894_1844 [Sporolactobacillus inulinus]